MNTIANENLPKTHGNSVFSLFQTSRLLQVAAAILVAQLGIAALLGLTQKQATFANGEPLFSLSEDDINSIAIDDGDEAISLKKQNDQWLIDGDTPLPVDAARLNTLKSSLTGLKVGLPVASSENAREQLEVADDQYQKKLVVNGDNANTFLLGTSPGLRKAHLRRDGSSEIYSASLPVSDMPTSVNQWLDKSLLALDDISHISSSAISFERVGSGEEQTWNVAGNDDDSKVVDSEKLSSAIKALETLRVIGLSDDSTKTSDNDSNTESDSDATDSNESLKLRITSKGDDLEFTLEKSDSAATITRSDFEQTFSVSTSLFEQLAVLGSDTDWFVDAEKIEEEKPAEQE